MDGADAVMLSGETAMGKYPVETVREMSAVIAAVENSEFLSPIPPVVQVADPQFSNAIARAAVSSSADFDISAIAVYTESGRTAALVSAYRPRATIVALSRRPEVLRRLALCWGVTPIQAEWAYNSDEMVDQAIRILLESDTVVQGDNIAVAFGRGDTKGPLQTDSLRLVKANLF
jgi:pyruvate kinase